MAVVTGAGGAIGRATALRLAAEGASVVVADIRGPAAAETADLVAESGGTAQAEEVDVSDEAAVSGLVERSLVRFGRLDVFHNNAAIIATDLPDADVGDLDVRVWDTKMAVNARGVMLGSKYAVRAMREAGNGGSIINMSSVSALVGTDVNIAYGSSKAAVIGLTRYVASMCGADGIRCNAVAPGVVLGAEVTSHLSPRQLAEMGAERLLPWAALPDDLAATVAFLASDESKCITGQTIVVDCGTTAHRPGHAMRRWERALPDLDPSA